MSAPAWEAVAEATGIGPGVRVLDIGCGSGEFCRMAADRRAAVSGIDAAQGMIAVARRHVPEGDFRVGAMERLPWADGVFDVVTGFNAFQFAADFGAALMEARRVVRVEGRVAICNWGRPQHNQLFTVLASARELLGSPSPAASTPEPPAIGEPGVLEDLARRAGLEPMHANEVDLPFTVRDEEELGRALLAPGGMVPLIEQSGEEVVRKAILDSAAPFRQPDGSYRIKNRFRYVICAA